MKTSRKNLFAFAAMMAVLSVSIIGIAIASDDSDAATDENFMTWALNPGGNSPDYTGYGGINPGETKYWTIPSTIPTKQGLTFIGWSLNDYSKTTMYQPGQTVTYHYDPSKEMQGIFLYAIYENDPNEYYIIDYTRNGGDTGQYLRSVIKAGESMNVRFTGGQPYIKAGYSLAGFQANGTGPLFPFYSDYTPTADTLMYAVWVPTGTTQHTLTLHANGGTGTMLNMTIYSGSTILMPENRYTAPADKLFTGWLNSADGHIYNPGELYTVTSNLTLRAQWEEDTTPPPQYTISYNANGGTGLMPLTSVNQGSSAILPQSVFTPPIDKKFVGWKLNNEGSIITAGTAFTPETNVTMFAQWENIVKHTISYDANGGTGIMNPLIINEGLSTNLPQSVFTPPANMIFAGWKVNNEGTTLSAGSVYAPTESVTMFAQWEEVPINSYIISYNANGGTGTTQSQTVTEGQSVVLRESTFTAPAGTKFIGWKVDNEGSLLLSSSQYSPTKNTVMFAQWDSLPPSVTVSYDLGIIDEMIDPQTSTIGDYIVVADPSEFATDEYTFGGWKVGDTSNILQAGEYFYPATNVTLHAIWNEKSAEQEQEPTDNTWLWVLVIVLMIIAALIAISRL